MFKPLFAGYKVGPWGWNPSLTPIEELRERIRSVREKMGERNIDCLLVFGAGDSTWRNGNVCYLSHSNVCYARWDVLILPLVAEPTLVGNFIPRDIPWEIRNTTWIKDVRTFENMDVAIKRVLVGCDIACARMGLVGAGNVDARSYQATIEAFPEATFVDATDLVENLRMLKSPCEMKVIGKASSIADLGVKTAQEAIIEGCRDFEIISEIDMATRKAGSHNFRYLMASGSDSEESLRMPENKVLRRGDMVIVIMGFEHWQYWAQVGRTFVVGDPSRDQTALYQGVVRAYEKAVESARPGLTVGELSSEISSVFASNGYADHLRSEYGFGHGLGVSIEEKPLINMLDTTVLQTQMALAIQVVVHMPGLGGVVLSDTFLLKKNGAERLTQAPYAL